ncbi:hypothetical protein JCM11641_003647 [Rhodosporidiobolus odoratus]
MPAPGSSAIPIVRPSASTLSTLATSTPAADANSSKPASPTPAPAKQPPSPSGTKVDGRAPENRLCRNILIYGSCKYKNRGCQFAHEVNPPASAASASPKPASPAPPAASSTPLSAVAASAAVFVPGSTAGDVARSATPGGSSMAGAARAAEFVPRRTATPALSEDAAVYAPSGTALPAQGGQAGEQMPENDAYDKGMEEVQAQNEAGLAEYYSQAMDLNADPSLHNPYAAHPNPYAGHALAPPGANGAPGLPPHTMGVSAAAEAAYYNNGMGGLQMGGMQMGGFVRQPLQYHLYHPLPSTNPRHVHSALPRSTATHSPTTSFFLPPSLHISLNQKSEATQATPSVEMKLPEEVGGYTGLLPLDQAEGGGAGGGWAGFKGTVYKAWREGEGRCYALRRIEGFRLQHEAAIAAVEKWTRVRHPGLVGMKEAFTTRAFGDQSIIFVYDYHPCSQTLYEAHLSPSATLPPNPWSTPHSPPFSTTSNSTTSFRRPPNPSQTSPGGTATLPERVLWSYIVQIASALKCVHNNGLAMRAVEVNRIVVTGKNRVRIGGAGVMDCLTWDGGQGTVAHQQDDLLSFGKLIIALACSSTSAVHNLPKSVDHISRMYSPDLKNVVLYLLSKPGPRKTIEEVFALMGARVVDELNSSLVAEDTIERELMRELENGRVVRLLTKFGFINERPEFDHDPRWAETGDRYLIKLFRDYVFHQVDETGRPVTDLGHVLGALNKLDAGVDEKIMLVSRDEQSCLIVSYREIKNCIESAFADLSRTSS